MIFHRSFSIIEIIFTIILIAIISSIAIPKLLNSSYKTTIIKAKSDLYIIQNALKTYKNNNILKNTTNTLNTLDDNDIYLFNNILEKALISGNNKISFWSKASNTTYHYWVETNTSIKFIYNKAKLTFTCDKTEYICQEVLK